MAPPIGLGCTAHVYIPPSRSLPPPPPTSPPKEKNQYNSPASHPGCGDGHCGDEHPALHGACHALPKRGRAAPQQPHRALQHAGQHVHPASQHAVHGVRHSPVGYGRCPGQPRCVSGGSAGQRRSGGDGGGAAGAARPSRIRVCVSEPSAAAAGAAAAAHCPPGAAACRCPAPRPGSAQGHHPSKGAWWMGVSAVHDVFAQESWKKRRLGCIWAAAVSARVATPSPSLHCSQGTRQCVACRSTPRKQTC
jgi:hypothetical protein